MLNCVFVYLNDSGYVCWDFNIFRVFVYEEKL